MEAIGAAATIVQLISFTGEVLLSGYKFLSRVHRAPSEIRALLREVANLNALLDQLKSLAEDVNFPLKNASAEKENPRNALQTLENLGVFKDCNNLMQVVERALKACEQVEGQEVRNFGKKLIWPFKEKETKDIIAQLARLREALSAAVIVDSSRTLRDVEKVAQGIDGNLIQALGGITELKLVSQNSAEDISYLKGILEAGMEEEERILMRKWLHPDGINVDASLATALAMKQSETGMWLLDSEVFAAWRESIHGCMWIYGIAGCGKTVLSATIIDHLQQGSSSESESTCVLFFFCDHRDPNMQSLSDLLHVMVKQLLDQNPACFEDAKYWYEERTRPVSGPKNAAKPLSTSEYINFIHQLCRRWKSVSLIVDALDECDGLDSFVGGLQDILRESNVRLLLTSRQDIDLQRAMMPMSDYQIPLMENMSGDIETYLTWEVQRRIARRTLKFKQKDLDKLIVAALKDKADGMILIAKLQLDYICGLRSDRAIKEALAKLPSGIYATYDEILHQLCSKNPDDIDDLKRILQWLVCSMVPLTLEQIAEVISIRPGDRKLDYGGIATDLMDVAACCGSLVTVHTQDTSKSQYEDLRGPRITMITLAHASVEEYLTSGKIGRGLSSIFHMDLKTVHHELGKTCSQYLGFEDFSLPLAVPSRYLTGNTSGESDLTLLRRLLRNRTSRYALVDYASRYWADHLRLSKFCEASDEQTIDLLDWFIQPEEHNGNYISWQQMYHHDVQWYCRNRPPLLYAIEFRIDSLVKLLLPPDAEIDTMTYDSWPQTPLHVAARCGALNTVQELLRRGASLELKSGAEARSMTALHFAAEGGHTEVIQYLLAAGASPDARSESQSTPFYRAARSGSIKALTVLHAAGSDINALTWDRFTPLFEAVAHGRSRTANQLLAWGADPEIVTAVGKSTVKLLQRVRNHEATKTGARWVTEQDILSEIHDIRSRGPAGPGFTNYLRNLTPQYVLAVSIDKDTRPGTEREKDYRWNGDPSRIVTMSEFRDRDD